jgi:alkylresorcinol/alkylpyrone synthase
MAFQINDRSKSNVIATALFADGAAACLVIGDDVPTNSSSPSILGSLSTTYPDTLDVMGWRITSEGFNIVLSRDIPSIVTGLVGENIKELLDAHGLTLADLKHYIAHPGGAKVMEAYNEALQLAEGDLRNSFTVLREYGNMSSATVFFILERAMREAQAGSGEYGLLSALGPGFSSELVLLKWD